MILQEWLCHLDPDFNLMCLEDFKSAQSLLFFNLFLKVYQSDQTLLVSKQSLSMKKLLEILKLFNSKFGFSLGSLLLEIIFLCSFLLLIDGENQSGFWLEMSILIRFLITLLHLLFMCYLMFLFFFVNFLLSEFIKK